MIDVVAILLMLLALLLAPEGDKAVTLDVVAPDQARVDTLTATRTADGFHIRGADGTGAVFKRHAEKAGVYVVTLAGGDEVEVNAGAVKKQLDEGTGDTRTAKQGETEIKVVSRGDVKYLFASGETRTWVLRPAPKSADRTLKGTVAVRKAPARMSVESYRVGDLAIKLEDGRVLTLVPTTAVTREQLERLDGKKVEVTGVESPGAKPHPMEAVPTDGKGQPLERAPRFEVKAVKAVE